jgi:hypothetical protein
VNEIGLCGLSGVGHGMLAALCLETLWGPVDGRGLRTAAALTLVGVAFKSAVEAVTGGVVLAGLHLGSVGTPIAACHAGGVLGTLAVFLPQWLRRSGVGRGAVAVCPLAGDSPAA